MIIDVDESYRKFDKHFTIQIRTTQLGPVAMSAVAHPGELLAQVSHSHPYLRGDLRLAPQLGQPGWFDVISS